MSSSRRICFISDLLVVRVVDDEPAADADRLAVGPQHPGAQRMERAGDDVAAALADQADDPLAELGRRAVGERHGQDPPRGDVLDADQVGDPMGQHARLARAGAGQDQQRALGGRDRAGLLGVERADDLLLAGPAGRGSSLRVGRRRRGCRVLAGDRRVAHPGRLLGRRRGRLGEVGEDRPGRARRRLGRGVERRIAGSASSGTHPVIVGRPAHPAMSRGGRSGRCRALGRPYEAGLTWSGDGAVTVTG